MFTIGQEELDAVAKVLNSGKLFRYTEDGECDRFEQRYAQHLGVDHVGMCASGTMALTAALIGVNVGPGDEVIVPAHTYMATAVAVLGVGAIPVIIDVDESICLDPVALDEAVGPRTKAVIPVHMWGQPCDMDAIMAVARKHKLIVIEDACQAVGGGYRGKMLGTIGHIGAFSFNYFKNMSCGEGGAVVTSDDDAFKRAQCAIDAHRYYWNDPDSDFNGFAFPGARASEIEGAIMNVQLDRLPGMLDTMRRHKQRILEETATTGLTQTPLHSLDDECGISIMYQLPDAERAERFAAATSGTILAKTGRHTYNEWHPILTHRGGPNPGLNPYEMPQNKGCRMDYSADMLPRSLDILARTVRLGNSPDHTDQRVTERIQVIKAAAAEALSVPA
ncbi:MAG: DegT/DnrJ/EryC1/StrS family aminotransferase [Phycisphaeraceae bacterium]